jgi:uncharacterized membrane protein
MRDRVMLKKWTVCLLAVAAAACSGQSGNKSADNMAITVKTNEVVVSDNGATGNVAGNSAATGSGGAAATASATYDANGTEPFWGLAIAGNQMTYTPADGSPVTEPLPAQIPIANGYRYQGAQLTVEVVHHACDNGMSERIYADTVVVSVGGENRHGCGGASTGSD